MRRSAILLGALTTCLAAGVDAADLRVLSAAAVQVPVTETAEQFMRETGHRVTFEFATAGQVDEKLSAGAHPDVVISSSGSHRRQDECQPRGRRGCARPGHRPHRRGARKGAARPDLSSAARFRDALVRAESITYGDPARGATTGIHFSRIVDQLDLRGILAGKTILAANGLDVVQKVRAGKPSLASRR
jgi:molybdate transport system substrate-binding protein